MTDYPAGTIAIATVKGVKNVKVLRRETEGGMDWAFNPVPELGLKYSCSPDREGLVTDIQVINTPDVVPERAPYDISSMSTRELERAIEDILGRNEEDDDEYYDDYTGANAFYHVLAGTQQHGDTYSYIKELPKGLSKTVKGWKIDGLGEFILVEKEDKYNESGDLDEKMVFSFNNKFYAKNGALDSWEGGLWDGIIREVSKVEKTITVWEDV